MGEYSLRPTRILGFFGGYQQNLTPLGHFGRFCSLVNQFATGIGPKVGFVENG
jgi:hypothetical protein